MFFPEGAVRVHVYGQPVDMRKSFDGLYALTRHALGCDPLSGELFVFINRRGTQMKVLYWDRTGFCVWAKRLEQGCFVSNWAQVTTRQMDWTGLKLLLEGIEAARYKRRFSLTNFPFFESRAHSNVEKILGLEPVQGSVLLSDGYGAYAAYASQTGLTHAQCWAHCRREFINAETAEPEQAAKALNYAYKRRTALEVFLLDPDVPIDTNHLERALRPIPLGRKNWMFSWTELGARHIGVIQSLIATCRLHQIDPYDYLVDVLQRVGQHPAADVALLTPRRWKQHFLKTPLRSDISMCVA